MGDAGRTTPRIGRYFRGEWRMLALVSVSGLIYNVGLAAVPWFEGQLAQCLADAIGGEAGAGAMALVALGYVATVALVQGMRAVKRLAVRKFANRINRRMKGELYAGMLDSSVAELVREGSGTLMTKSVADVDACAEGMRKATTEVFDTGVALVSYTAMLLCYDWRLALISLLFPPLTYAMAAALRRVVTRASAGAKESMGRMNAATLDRVQGALTYRVFGLEAQRDAAYERCLADYERAEGRANILQNAPRPLYYAVSMTGVFLVLVLGARNVLGQGWAAWDIAAFTAFVSCYARLTAKSSHAANLFNAVQRAAVSWERVKPILAASPALREQADGARPAEGAGSPASSSPVPGPATLEVRDLSVAFGQDAPVFEGVSFTLEPGCILGVTGEVACGKSTLGRALIGDVSCTGSVTYGGRPMRTLVEAGACPAAYLGHDPELLGASMADNVRLGASGDVWPALRAVRLDREVEALPQGEDTPVGEGGVRLSGGQRARLGLARALYSARPLLVLDDPFSAVDRGTEGQVMGELFAWARRTRGSAVIMSHRLSHFPEFDQVAYLEGGHAMLGTHEELLSSCPGYARLYRIQTQGTDLGGEACDEA